VGEDYREFRDEQEQLRTGCAQALGRIKPRGATAALKDRITAAYTENERTACLWAIGQIGYSQVGIDALKVQLKDSNPVIRIHAAIAIVKMDDNVGDDEIEAAFTDARLAPIALQGLEESSYFGVPLLMRLSTDGGPQQQALRQIIDKVKDQLVTQLTAEEPVHRLRAANALGQIGDPGPTQALANLLTDPSNQVRFSAAAALATLDQAQGIDFLFQALRNTDSILRANAVKFLAEVQSQSGSVESQLISALSAEAPLARAGAAQVLGQARVQTAIASLIEATTDKTADVRVNAIIALGQIGTGQSRARLESLRTDDDATVAYYAEWALGQLGPS
jgi:HEAT repeat protein